MADHAADALAALEDRDAAPMLVALLGKPDPAAPFTTKMGASVHELVRLNHIGNCLLCHVPATGRDAVTDVDPFANRPQQTFEPGKYGGAKIPGASGGIWKNNVLIRADVQFFRQDFSIRFPVNNTFATVQGLRFDFLIRTRPLKTAEIAEWKKQSKGDPTAYPQRQSVLYALRTVTGQDVGPTTEAWTQIYPHATAEAEGLRLSTILRRTLPDQRDQLLARYRDAKEEHYSEALANAIPHFTGKFQEKVRTTLVERLARQSPEQIRAHLQDEDPELHRAAALACIRKADADMVPELIELLLDSEAELADGAHAALKRISGEDFGPAADAVQEDRINAMTKWHEWQRTRVR